jgi:predicted amidohydrolase
MNKVTVALLQMNPCSQWAHPDQTIKKGLDFCHRASEAGADIILFPEMWNTGYFKFEAGDGETHERWLSQAVTIESEFIRAFQEAARSLGSAIAVTYLEKTREKPRNTVSLIDRTGAIVLSYSKVHTCDFGSLEANCAPGEHFPVATLATGGGPIEVGMMICYDREHPESARILMLNGAELVLTPNACQLEEKRIGQFQTRAYENAMNVAMANYAAPHKNGHSVAFDCRGDRVVEADEGEGVVLAEFDLDEARAYRARTIWGNAYRRPHRYKELCDRRVAEPFPRKDALGNTFNAADR